ncbi:putative secreted protein (Por secretion system target) [Marinoscillum furvescens DSM 4134]|uniref:Putative secreted protein (Por secretion system target) n=2 Tax=Marinoscillum furvescens TaxID=1026 RepID=A0A3D9KXS2_MARFU|nr:putative secreted protein (Por secretion system target) [Marinoscillum furvescens DSM 4134]
MNAPITVEVVNMSGETLLKAAVFSDYTIDTSNWPTGVYLFRHSGSEEWKRIRKE